ncbi:hypothetical protein BD289DRAFT_70847 [Coniella lustricola]|uniref:DUF2293 domain-containing protein n=1 Tax=Coniella lustricola TaxID=2025994 RepID=A0A2T2ZZW6_9PEZI|nr:hypothetical protein BD289DRAFT_70847 [Coniella lustricola]
MGRNKGHNALAVAAASRSVKERHHRAARDNVALPRNLVAIPEKNIKSKHQSYFQFFENKDRKDKKLEFQVTTDTNPPPGFEFVPIGNPELTKACKEISREQDAMIFIVSAAKDAFTDAEDDVNKLALQVHRMGHHVRRTIVETAKAQVGRGVVALASDNWQLPDTQEEINVQAEAAMRDLFPRIPNFDKQMIIEHSFRKVGPLCSHLADVRTQLTGHAIQGKEYGKPKVGTSDLPLHRRVQLAVLAHIRHTHTRYDELLKEADWHTARKVVEKICLDILVKWRGDEETGRDQLDDILREVVVISDDSEDSDSDDEESSDEVEDSVQELLEDGVVAPRARVADHMGATRTQHPGQENQRKILDSSGQIPRQTQDNRDFSKKDHGPKKNKRGFKRYEAVQKRWEEAVDRNRQEQGQVPVLYAQMGGMPGQSATQRPSLELISPLGRAEPAWVPPAWDNRTYAASQPLRSAAPSRPCRAAPEESFYADHLRENARPLAATRPPSAFAPREAVMVGRRVARPAVDIRSTPGPERGYHKELKDYLVPSIELSSPQFPSEAQHSGRQVVRAGAPSRPGQVPVGHADAPTLPAANPGRGPVVSDFQRAIPTDPRCQPALAVQLQDHMPLRQELHYDYESQRHPPVSGTQEVHRIYRIREPVLHDHGARRDPMISTSSIIRGREEARPMGTWRSERDLSPHRRESHRSVSVLPVYENDGRPRAVHDHVSAHALDTPYRAPAIESTRPLYYEVKPASQTGHWQRGNVIRPAQYSPTYYAQEQQHGPREVLVRRPVQDIRPLYQDSVNQSQRGQVIFCCRSLIPIADPEADSPLAK